LRKIPKGSPSILQPNLIPSEALVDFPKFLDYLKPKNKTWWQQWLSDQPLPAPVVPEGN
jgi:hypothetical protein